MKKRKGNKEKVMYVVILWRLQYFCCSLHTTNLLYCCRMVYEYACSCVYVLYTLLYNFKRLVHTFSLKVLFGYETSLVLAIMPLCFIHNKWYAHWCDVYHTNTSLWKGNSCHKLKQITGFIYNNNVWKITEMKSIYGRICV